MTSLTLRRTIGIIALAALLASSSMSLAQTSAAPDVMVVINKDGRPSASTDFMLLKDPQNANTVGGIGPVNVTVTYHPPDGRTTVDVAKKKAKLFSEKIERIQGLDLVKGAVSVDDKGRDALIKRIQSLGIPLADDTYAFNLCGVMAEVGFSVPQEMYDGLLRNKPKTFLLDKSGQPLPAQISIGFGYVPGKMGVASIALLTDEKLGKSQRYSTEAGAELLPVIVSIKDDSIQVKKWE